MRIDHCYFCSGPCYPGHGMTFVRNDCKVFKFCRPKCHKAFLKKRNPRKIRWTKAFRKSHNKEMKVDSAFEFEKVRNTPVRYDRDLVAASIQALERVGDITEVRDKRFYKARMAGKKAALKAAHKVEIENNINLIAPAVVRKTGEVNMAAQIEKTKTSNTAVTSTTTTKKSALVSRKGIGKKKGGAVAEGGDEAMED